MPRKKRWKRFANKRKSAVRRMRRRNPRASRTPQVSVKLRRRFKRFWGVEPTAMKRFNEKPLRSLIPHLRGLVSMGRSDRVVLRLDGAPGVRTLRGKWTPYTDQSGKRILILSGAKIRPPFKKIGTAPETWYYATPSMEMSGTHKKRTMWRHKHTDDGGKPPVVFVDRNGKVDRRSNFVYGPGTYTVTDWIRR